MEEITDFTTLISNKLVRWTEAFIKLLPNIVLAAVIVTIGFFIARWLKRLANKLISKISHNAAITNLFTSLIYVFLLSIVLFSALSVLQLDKAVTSLLAGAGIIGIALAFAFQDIASNFMSGIFIIVRQPLKVGDSVILDKFSGTVVEINLRDTVIRTAQGVLVTIPNKEVFQKPIQNVNELERRRYDLHIGVSYAEDLAKVKEVALEAIRGIENISEKFPAKLVYREFADSSINFDLLFWVELGPGVDFLETGSQAIQAIKIAFDRENISIPFPVQTMDFGIKGGTSLSEEIQNQILSASEQPQKNTSEQKPKPNPADPTTKAQLNEGQEDDPES